MSLKSTNLEAITQPGEGPLRRHSHTYDLMRQCIHCGFCLPTCPTYAVLGVEMDSPRGRIYQMQAVAEGRMEVSPEFVDHMYCCLGCRACETACPSGVQFGKLIEAAREQIQLEVAHRPPVNGQAKRGETEEPLARGDEDYPLHTDLPRTPALETLTERLLRRFFFDIVLPSRLVTSLVFAGLKVYQRSGLQSLAHRTGLIDLANALPTPLQGQLKMPEELMPPASGDLLPRLLPEITPASGRRRYRVGFISGCISAGCGSNLKEYGHLLRDDPAYADRGQAFSAKVKDISEFLASIELNQDMGEVSRTVAYHDACHLVHGQKIKQQPRQLLQTIPGITMVNLKESDWCCGSAGIYNITNQEMASTLLERKMNNIGATGASVIATGNPGCMMQIALGARERGMEIDVVHPIQLLDEAYRAGGLYEIPVRDVGTKQRQQRSLLIGIGIGVLAGMLLVRRRRRRSIS